MFLYFFEIFDTAIISRNAGESEVNKIFKNCD